MGPSLKRFRSSAAQGGAFAIKKQTCHISIAVAAPITESRGHRLMGHKIPSNRPATGITQERPLHAAYAPKQCLSLLPPGGISDSQIHHKKYAKWPAQRCADRPQRPTNFEWNSTRTPRRAGRSAKARHRTKICGRASKHPRRPQPSGAQLWKSKGSRRDAFLFGRSTSPNNVKSVVAFSAGGCA